MTAVATVVQSATNSGANNITSSNGLTLGSTPAAGAVVILAIKSTRAAGARTVSSVSGLGATWASLYSPGGARVAYWIGTGATTSGGITVTMSNVGNAHATAYVVTGHTNTTVVGVTATASGTSLNGTGQTAGDGQLAIASGLSIIGTLTYPSAQSPSGWTVPGNVALGTETIGDAYRLPSSSASHSTNIGSTSSTTLEVTSIVFGDIAPPGSSQVEFGAPIR